MTILYYTPNTIVKFYIHIDTCMKNLEQLIKDIFLFDSLTPEQITLVTRFCSLKNISKGEQLFLEGQMATAFFVIVSGKVKVYKLSPEGIEHIMTVQSSGGLVAEAAILDLQTYPAYCQAMEDTVLIRIPKDDFIQLILDNPRIALKIMNSYSKRLRHFVNLVEELSLHDIKSRLAKYIVGNYVTKNEKNVFTLTVTKKELAAILGTIPETLSRTLGYFKKQQMIEEKGDTIVILNLPGLKSFI